jgi:predicted enzyme related to lactoylglutathione lyase
MCQKAIYSTSSFNPPEHAMRCHTLCLIALFSFAAMAALAQPPAGPANTPTAPTSASSPLAKLDWLAGRWVREQAPNQYLEEIWSPPAGDALTGMFRWSRDGKAWMCELMSITVENDQTLFRLRHFDRALKPWEKDTPLTYGMTRLTDREVVFEDPDSGPDHPRRFIYERAGDELSVILEAADGKRDVFSFQRADDSESTASAGATSPIGFTGGMLVRFQTADRAKAVKWYREVLGFEILFEVNEIGWSELVNREAKLTIGLMQNPADKGGANASEGVVPVLGVKDIAAARTHLESKGVKFTGPTQTIPELVKLATLLDPDGHRIMLYQSRAE